MATEYWELLRCILQIDRHSLKALRNGQPTIQGTVRIAVVRLEPFLSSSLNPSPHTRLRRRWSQGEHPVHDERRQICRHRRYFRSRSACNEAKDDGERRCYRAVARRDLG